MTARSVPRATKQDPSSHVREISAAATVVHNVTNRQGTCLKLQRYGDGLLLFESSSNSRVSNKKKVPTTSLSCNNQHPPSSASSWRPIFRSRTNCAPSTQS